MEGVDLAYLRPSLDVQANLLLISWMNHLIEYSFCLKLLVILIFLDI